MPVASRLAEPEDPEGLSAAVGPSKPRVLGILGPGLITGASDDDPSGIATYGQAGAQLGYALCWTLLYSLPLMAAVQMVAARIGRTAGHGIADIQTSAQAAGALRPLAGPFSATVFALGISGTGLLAVPVLAGSAAYAVGEARRWPVGFGRHLLEARAFYGTMVLATLVGMIVSLGAVDPIRALYWSAVVNGVIAVPIMAVMMLAAARTDIMGPFAVRGPLRWLGWLATACMLLAVVAMLIRAIH
ncbi:divalent metal cation transporter [Methylobacterium goesingense]|uniref:Mn2+/Fe2+ NRAMP family transporter n=1 Tax=Methylobacterium goesingense TaxID=243690 RepID=A0ABV2LC40_9HYPH|nr:divalent metal cation transporter [Methylobacterium goesingense]GJD76359.1 Divalent metal cation transporter MntH [Methylobacterium goesingense]